MNFLAPRPREGATSRGWGRQWKVEMETGWKQFRKVRRFGEVFLFFYFEFLPLKLGEMIQVDIVFFVGHAPLASSHLPSCFTRLFSGRLHAAVDSSRYYSLTSGNRCSLSSEFKRYTARTYPLPSRKNGSWKKMPILKRNPRHFPSFSASKIVRRVVDTSFGNWLSLDSRMAQARRPIRRGNVMKVEVFLWLQLWPTRRDAVESSCLKWKMSLNILEHTSWQELTCNPFLNWKAKENQSSQQAVLQKILETILRVSTGIEWTSW